VLMQTDVNAVAESAVEGQEAEGMMRKLGTTSLNQGVVEQSSESHWPVAVSASLVRFRTRVSVGVLVVCLERRRERLGRVVLMKKH
jgi:hypothetical protein